MTGSFDPHGRQIIIGSEEFKELFCVVLCCFISFSYSFTFFLYVYMQLIKILNVPAKSTFNLSKQECFSFVS